ncbi:ABC transporter substrate-binding protein [Variovorax guangxiensis]|uniref:ABC transporter substrate-binding protein n=1 Tax=Variovorax guangxiensis TaxID=1775474 RepID=UPI002860475B|nr:ABC transporter substrate-binding protein [Variovorax guangxiensis]MDR6861129.1 branched-chain amino acid transport system substrate-binding protein [Variovorax guangxiensis]
MNLKARVVACVFAAATSLVAAQSQGITKTEIVLGSITDLSGPAASVGKPQRQGMLMRMDELNELGGVHGRKIKLLVEDSAYDPKRAVLAAQKLVNLEKAFAVAGTLGTAPNMATMPVLFEKSVINFYPMTGAREMYEPAHRLKVAFLPNYYDQMRVAVPRLLNERNLKKPCILYQDDEFGLEVARGTEAGLKTAGMELVEKTTYKRGATDFSSQVAKLKAASCDMVILGTIVRETVGAVVEARKIGFNPVFLTHVGAYSDVTARLGGKAMDGLFATHTAQIPYADDSSQQVRHWAAKYRTKFGEEPSEYATYGYHIADAFIRIAQQAGPDLTTDSFIKALETVALPRDLFGFMEESFSATKRLGNPYSRLSQLQDGRWRVVSDYITFNGLKVEVGKDGRMKMVLEQFKQQ